MLPNELAQADLADVPRTNDNIREYVIEQKPLLNREANFLSRISVVMVSRLMLNIRDPALSVEQELSESPSQARGCHSSFRVAAMENESFDTMA